MLTQSFMIVVLLLAAALCRVSSADELSIFDLSLEELLKIKIETLSKSEEDFLQSPRAVFIVTQSDIYRAGARSVPEALRLVPGVHVAQISGHRWAISIRGFQQEFAGKLLVLLDGRAVYTPTFSGVHWDAQNIPIDLLDKIEVIRGPASVTWGSNAMNGVINIVTKKASDNPGSFASVSGGTEDDVSVTVRQAWDEEDWSWQLYGYHAQQGDRSRTGFPSNTLEGISIYDGWAHNRVGGSVEHNGGAHHARLIANVYDGEIRDIADAIPLRNPSRTEDSYFDGELSGYDISIRSSYQFSEHQALSLQAFIDSNDRVDANINEARESTDFEGQYMATFGGHSIRAGAGVRSYSTETWPHLALSFEPSNENQQITNVFIHDDWQLTDRFAVNAGVKVEHSRRTDNALQPAFGLSWQFDQALLWFNFERAERLTSRAERGLRARVAALAEDALFEGQPEGFAVLTGQENLNNEELDAFELGLRSWKRSQFYWDLSLYYFDYERLIFLENREFMGTPFVNDQGVFILPVLVHNSTDGHVKGGEFVFNYEVNEQMTLKAAFTYTDMQLDGGESASAINGETPDYQFNIRSLVNLSDHWDFDTALFFVDDLPGFSGEFDKILRVDLRVGWQPNANWRFSLGAQNIGDDKHVEHAEKGFSTHSEVPRSAYLRASMGF